MREPVPGWLTDSIERNRDHGFWMVSLIRQSDQRLVAVTRDGLPAAWKAAVSSAAYYSKTDSEPLTGPPSA
jgi:hypothetical protein